MKRCLYLEPEIKLFYCTTTSPLLIGSGTGVFYEDIPLGDDDETIEIDD